MAHQLWEFLQVLLSVKFCCMHFIGSVFHSPQNFTPDFRITPYPSQTFGLLSWLLIPAPPLNFIYLRFFKPCPIAMGLDWFLELQLKYISTPIFIYLHSKFLLPQEVTSKTVSQIVNTHINFHFFFLFIFICLITMTVS